MRWGGGVRGVGDGGDTSSSLSLTVAAGATSFQGRVGVVRQPDQKVQGLPQEHGQAAHDVLANCICEVDKLYL